MMEECAICGDKFEESDIFVCERCGRYFCLDCSGDECCYNVELCKECDEVFAAWWQDFITGGGD